MRSESHRLQYEQQVQALAAARARARAGAVVEPGLVPDQFQEHVSLARKLGAPVTEVLDRAVAALARARTRDLAIDGAIAQAQAVAFGVAALPVLAVGGLGALLGEPLWRFYLTPIDLLVGAAGVSLAAVGSMISASLVRRVRDTRPRVGRARGWWLMGLAGLLLAGPAVGGVVALVVWKATRTRRPALRDGVADVVELVAIATSAGLPPGAAMRAAAPSAPEFHDALYRSARALELGSRADLEFSATLDGLETLGALLAQSKQWGAPATAAVRSLAEDIRSEADALAVRRAERLPMLLTIPIALCLLPSAVLLAGAPLVAHGLASVGGP